MHLLITRNRPPRPPPPNGNPGLNRRDPLLNEAMVLLDDLCCSDRARCDNDSCGRVRSTASIRRPALAVRWMPIHVDNPRRRPAGGQGKPQEPTSRVPESRLGDNIRSQSSRRQSRPRDTSRIQVPATLTYVSSTLQDRFPVAELAANPLIQNRPIAAGPQRQIRRHGQRRGSARP